MQDVPHIVRKRLQAAVPDSAHPNADVLTAFGEKSLPEQERAKVFQHISRCSDCREILALSMPEEPAAQLVTKPTPTRWLTWPVLRWGVVAAGIVLVSSVGLIQYRRAQTPRLAQRTESVEVALKQEPSPPSSAPVSSEKPADVRAPMVATTGRGKDASPKEKAKTEPGFLHAPQRPDFQTKAATNGALMAGSSVGGPVKKQDSQQQAYQAQMSPAASMVRPPSVAWATTANAPKSSSTVEVSGTAPLLDAKAQPAPAELSIAPSGDEATAALSRAKPATTPAVPATKMALAVPRWTISAAGGLQRSFDQGQTWQDVNVTANEMSSANSVQDLAKAPMDRAVVTKQRAAGLTFRAVSANGADVWAGGIGGVLYHSLDAGNNWMRVALSSAGATATGDILSVEFADVQQGRIQTSSGEIWTTGDDGQSWQKQ